MSESLFDGKVENPYLREDKFGKIFFDRNENGVPTDFYIRNNDEDFYADLGFQYGPVEENGEGVNGCTNEQLIAIVLERMQYFQETEYATRENSLAITKLEEALHWMNHRTLNRKARGVEGKHTK